MTTKEVQAPMQTPQAVPVGRICQFFVFFDYEVIFCGKELKGRGPYRWCPFHRLVVRRIKNCKNKQEQRRRQHENGNWLSDIGWWHAFMHRRRKGMRIRYEVFYRLFTLCFPLSLPSNLILSLRIKFEAYSGAIDFHAFTSDGG